MQRRSLLTASLAAAPALAADWPCFRGPNHNGVSSEKLLTTWPAGGPKKLWNAQIGEGYSAAVVVGKRLITMGVQNNDELVWCLDAETGKEMWRSDYRRGPRGYSADPFPNGSGATPAVDGDRVYTLSREGLALGLNLATGKVLWKRDLARATGGAVPSWGFTGSPLIEGALAVYNVGTRGVALNKTTGAVLWKTGSVQAGYATPVAYGTGAGRALAMFTYSAIEGVAPASGKQLWSFPWTTHYGVNGADPIVVGTQVFVSSNYGYGCGVIDFSGRPRAVWQNKNMMNHFNSSIYLGGYLYGNDNNTLKCLDWRTGEEKWKMRGGLGKGGLIAADGHLIVLGERGTLWLVKATPAKQTTVAEAKVLGGTCWTQPTLANGRLYVRNANGELACLETRA